MVPPGAMCYIMGILISTVRSSSREAQVMVKAYVIAGVDGWK